MTEVPSSLVKRFENLFNLILEALWIVKFEHLSGKHETQSD